MRAGAIETGAARPRGEDELIAHARDGDADAYNELVRRHQEIAFRTAMLITRNAADAEEAAQDGFVKAWGALDSFRPGRPLKPWLLAIVANEARNRRRSAARHDHLDLPASGGAALDRSAPAPEHTILATERRDRLLAALGALPGDDRLVLGCRFLLELSESETAAALAIRPGTVKSRTARALERLRMEMEGDADA